LIFLPSHFSFPRSFAFSFLLFFPIFSLTYILRGLSPQANCTDRAIASSLAYFPYIEQMEEKLDHLVFCLSVRKSVCYEPYVITLPSVCLCCLCLCNLPNSLVFCAVRYS
jgi:hypothetical protein